MSEDLRTLCDLLHQNAEHHSQAVSHRWKTETVREKTWGEFRKDVAALTAGLRRAGVSGGSVALFSDNRYEWAVTDQALLHLGCPSVPRGSDTAPKEQKLIFLHSDARWLIVEGAKNLTALVAEFGSEDRLPERVFVIDAGGEYPAAWASRVTAFADLGDAEPGLLERLREERRPDETASIIYTSGTSGNPKGVVLTHANFLHNVRAIGPLLQVDPHTNELAVSILPVWHVYERTFEYVTTQLRMILYYSSVRTLADDLVKQQPTIVASVPRVWESIYGKLQDRMAKEKPARRALFRFFVSVASSRYRAGLALKNWRPRLRPNPFRWLGLPVHALAWLLLSPLNAVAQLVFGRLRALMGSRFRVSFSGGGSLPPVIDFFFNTIGIKLVNAYGMTESAPGSITRRLDRNVPGSIGIPLDGVQVKVVKEDGSLAARGEKGLIHVRGANVMPGYYKNPAATAEVIDAEGWLNTGDLGALSLSGDYVITGRAKSTIVLVGGENVEPEPIEEKLQESDLIEHAVVVGQDQKSLHAILTVNDDHLKKLGDRLKVKWDELWHQGGEILSHNKVLEHLGAEIKRLINRENGFKPFEAITKFVVLKKKFQVGDELTQTLKVKRKVVEDRYATLLDEKKKEN